MATLKFSAAAKVTNGSPTVTCTDATDLSGIKPGYVVWLGGQLVEVTSGTTADGSGVSSATLARPWPHATTAEGPMLVVPTLMDLIAATEAVRQLSSTTTSLLASFETLLTDATRQTIPIEVSPGHTVQVTGYAYAASQIGSLLTSAQDTEQAIQDNLALIGDAPAHAQTALDAKDSAIAYAVTAVGVEIEPGVYSALHWASQAAGSATAAANSAGQADDRASDAETAKGASEAARDLALAYANGLVDVEVAPGLYSALHHLTKASEQASAAADSATAADGRATDAETARDQAQAAEQAAKGYRDEAQQIVQGDIFWSSLKDTPTTVADYGITDAYTKTEADNTTEALTARLDEIELYALAGCVL